MRVSNGSCKLFMDCQSKTEQVTLILKDRQINKIIVFECKLINN